MNLKTGEIVFAYSANKRVRRTERRVQRKLAPNISKRRSKARTRSSCNQFAEPQSSGNRGQPERSEFCYSIWQRKANHVSCLPQISSNCEKKGTSCLFPFLLGERPVPSLDCSPICLQNWSCRFFLFYRRAALATAARAAGFFFGMKISAGRLNRALSLRICSRVIGLASVINIETALSEPNSGTRSRCVRFCF